MLEERVARWPKEWLEQGLEQGRQEGRQEGRRLGQVELLKKMAKHRFGKLPRWVLERLDRAAIDTLDRWSSRFLDAERVEDVFDEDSE